jgi:hypothetical protein
MRRHFRWEGRSASRGVFGIRRSVAIPTVSNSRCIEGILHQYTFLEQWDTVIRVNWFIFKDLARMAYLHRRITLYRYLSHIYKAF